jgi:hypothetical protein
VSIFIHAVHIVHTVAGVAGANAFADDRIHCLPALGGRSVARFTLQHFSRLATHVWLSRSGLRRDGMHNGEYADIHVHAITNVENVAIPERKTRFVWWV